MLYSSHVFCALFEMCWLKARFVKRNQRYIECAFSIPSFLKDRQTEIQRDTERDRDREGGGGEKGRGQEKGSERKTEEKREERRGKTEGERERMTENAK